MSTFTDWNGPQGSGPARSDWRDLIQNYKDAINALGQKQDKLVFDTKPTAGSTNPVTSGGIANITDSLQASLTALQNLVSRDYITTNAADSKYQYKFDISKYSTTDSINSMISTALANYCKTTDVNSIKAELQADINKIKAFAESDTIDKVNVNGTYITGLIKAVEQVQFTDKVFAATTGGSDDVGVYYILGMLKDKGTAYISMQNSKPFSAVINFAVTNDLHGALSITTDCELNGLKFKIVYGTKNGEKHAYLAIQSTEWISEFAGTDSVGIFPSIEFIGSGINFIPVDSDGYIAPNSTCHDICDCISGRGFSFSELATTILGEQIYREDGNPYVTANDINALDCVGVISQWPLYDKDSCIAIEVPDGYHACDGTDVLDTDNVSEEFREKFNQYPLIDYSIIKTSSTIDVSLPFEEDLPSVSRKLESLASSVCELHGIKYYTSVDELPEVAKVGEPVIVAMGRKFAVYTYKNDLEKWQKYSTTFNDIESTIAAITAVIAAEHGANVYTVYSSAADLPKDINVETGAMAIVFDGAYTVFKYNGTAWEIQP